MISTLELEESNSVHAGRGGMGGRERRGQEERGWEEMRARRNFESVFLNSWKKLCTFEIIICLSLSKPILHSYS